MEFQPSLKKSQTSAVVKVFAIISLALTVIGAFTYFINIEYVSHEYENYWGGHHYEEYAYMYFSFPDFLEIIFLLFRLLPVISFFIFAVILSKKEGKRKYSIIFAIIFANAIYDLFYSIVNMPSVWLIYAVIYLIKIVAAILGFVAALTRYKSNALARVSSILLLIVCLIFLIETLFFNDTINHYFYDGLDTVAYLVFVQRIADIFFSIALLIFSVQVNKKPELSTEEQLQIIKEKYELGIITQEEYSAQRMEVLSKI